MGTMGLSFQSLLKIPLFPIDCDLKMQEIDPRIRTQAQLILKPQFIE